MPSKAVVLVLVSFLVIALIFAQAPQQAVRGFFLHGFGPAKPNEPGGGDHLGNFPIQGLQSNFNTRSSNATNPSNNTSTPAIFKVPPGTTNASPTNNNTSNSGTTSPTTGLTVLKPKTNSTRFFELHSPSFGLGRAVVWNATNPSNNTSTAAKGLSLFGKLNTGKHFEKATISVVNATNPTNNTGTLPPGSIIKVLPGSTNAPTTTNNTSAKGSMISNILNIKHKTAMNTIQNIKRNATGGNSSIGQVPILSQINPANAPPSTNNNTSTPGSVFIVPPGTTSPTGSAPNNTSEKGTGQGKIRSNEFTISKTIDKASPAFFRTGNNNTGTLPPGSLIKVPPGTTNAPPAGNTTNPSNNTGTTTIKALQGYLPLKGAKTGKIEGSITSGNNIGNATNPGNPTGTVPAQTITKEHNPASPNILAGNTINNNTGTR